MLKKNKLKLITRIFYGLVILVLALIAGTVAISALDIPGGFKLYTVMSGSMEPTLPVGSLVVVKSQDNYGVEDIVTYKAEKDRSVKNPQNTTTHRIARIEEGDYVTRGDANEVEDLVPVKKDLVLGKVVFSLPLIGRVVSFAKTREGLIFLVVVPAVIIVYSEILNIKSELVRIYKKVKEVDQEVDEIIEEKEKKKRKKKK